MHDRERDRRAARRALWGGFAVTAIGGIQVGLAIRAVTGPEMYPGARPQEVIGLVLAVLFLGVGALGIHEGWQLLTRDRRDAGAPDMLGDDREPAS